MKSLISQWPTTIHLSNRRAVSTPEPCADNTLTPEKLICTRPRQRQSQRTKDTAAADRPTKSKHDRRTPGITVHDAAEIPQRPYRQMENVQVRLLGPCARPRTPRRQRLNPQSRFLCPSLPRYHPKRHGGVLHQTVDDRVHPWDKRGMVSLPTGEVGGGV